MLKKSLPKTPKYFCEKCQYKTNNKKDFSKHLLTAKHKNLTNFNKNLTENSNKSQDNQCQYCNKIYKSRVGLWYHQKKCNQETYEAQVQETENKIQILDGDFITYLIKENSELKSMMMKFFENGSNNTNTNNNINNVNSNNKSFNLNVFLNETCKNAMNITDFINSIQLNLTDLEKVGELGYVEGISKIIIDNLKLLDITERPVHCSDFKRDVLYVKDADKWEKENEDNSKIKRVINSITNKNISLIPKWKKENPDCIYSDSVKSTKINKIIMEAMETDKSKQDKIIKNIAKEVTINKN